MGASIAGIICRFALLAALVIACAKRDGGSAAPGPEEWTRVVGNPFEGTLFVARPFTRVMAQAVDVRTHRFVPGAELLSIEVQPRLPRTRRVTLARGVADEFGYAHVPVFPDRWWTNVVTAPGYAPFAESTIGEVPVRLVPGIDVRIRVFDALGRPAPGVRAQYYYGSGDEPNWLEPLTDEKGFATLRCIDPTQGILFPVGPGVGGEDIELLTVPSFDGVRLIHAAPGLVVEGRVLDADGTPIDGACVGSTGWNHGPWTRTDRHGAFRLVGVQPFTALRVYRSVEGDEVVADFDAPPPGVPVVVRAGQGSEATERVEIQLTVPAAPKVRPDDVFVCAVRADDGRTETARTKGSWGGTYLDLAAGRWEVRIGSDVGPYVQKRVRIDVRAGEKNAFEIPVERWPEVGVAIPRLDVGWGVVLTSEYDQRWLTDEEERHGLVRLPRDRELALRVVDSRESTAGFPGCLARIAKGADLAAEAKVAAPPEWDWQGPLRRFAARWSEEEGFPGFVTVVDAGRVPVPHASVWRSYGSWCETDDVDDAGQAPGGPDGTHVVVHASDERGPMGLLRARLAGEGPWTLRFGTSAVRIEVRDHSGQPVSWWGFFPDGTPAEGVEEDVEMHGLEPGLYRILACAEGTRAVVRQFRLRDGGMRPIRIVLPRR